MIYTAKHIPRELAEAIDWFARSKSAKFTEIKQEITFDMFWNKYDDKVLSSKKRTQKKWESMKKNEQINAFNHITKYFQSIPNGLRKKIAECYLNAEQWNN
jgi:hypothetical protein